MGVRGPLRLATWLYGGSSLSHVGVFESDVAYGTGDYEDEPLLGEDRERTCYYVFWGRAGEPVEALEMGSRFGPFDTLEEGIAHVEASAHARTTLCWVVASNG